jgi:hypothetical protein
LRCNINKSAFSFFKDGENTLLDPTFKILAGINFPRHDEAPITDE